MNLIDEARTRLEAAAQKYGGLIETRRADHEQARLLIEMENALQARITNLLTLAGLGIEESPAAAAEAAALLAGSDSAAEVVIREFCEEIQIAGNDYHARITAGQIVNLLAGRDPNDDGALMSSFIPPAPPAVLPSLAA